MTHKFGTEIYPSGPFLKYIFPPGVGGIPGVGMLSASLKFLTTCGIKPQSLSKASKAFKGPDFLSWCSLQISLCEDLSSSLVPICAEGPQNPMLGHAPTSALPFPCVRLWTLPDLQDMVPSAPPHHDASLSSSLHQCPAGNRPHTPANFYQRLSDGLL